MLIHQRKSVMKQQLRMPIFLAYFLTVLLAGCVSLKDVRQYANESAKLSSYKELTDRFRDTYEREKPFLGSGSYCDARRAKIQDNLRKSAYPDLIKMHDRLAEYMAALAVLSGDDTFDLTKPIGTFGDSIKKHPNLSIDAKEVDAYVQLGKILSQLITTVMQQNAIRKTVTNADPHVQTLLEGMSLIVRVYKVHNSKERGCVVEFLEQESKYASKFRSTALLGVVGLQMALDKAAEYDQVEHVIEKVLKGIEAIKEGHHELKVNVNNLSNAELASTLKRLSGDIKSARKELETLN